MSGLNRKFRWTNAKNAHVYSGKSKYIDFTSGIFACNTGFCNGNVISEIIFTAEAIPFGRGYGTHTYNYSTNIRDEYEERLCEWTGYDEVALFTTGSEAVEAALRVMGIDDYEEIFAVPDAFHGKTYGPRKELCRWGFATKEEPYEAAASMTKPVWDNWIIEGYRGWDAYFWPEDFINHLKECQNKGFLVCFDEVQSGFGRTGKKFAYEHYKIKPDILVIGKGSHSGFPGSGILSRKGLISGFGYDELSSTHGGNPLACAAGLATLAEFDRLNLVEEARRKGEILHERLNGISGGRICSGRGLVAAIHFETRCGADSCIVGCRDRGLLLVHTGKNTVKIGPPLTIPDDVLLEGLEILREVLQKL